ncbi:MAG TPA: TonB-dependent receptor [Bryobacteraceae bacterium]|nr:TonB-dependent receptor [Bryobacteraceae bacterium]
MKNCILLFGFLSAIPLLAQVDTGTITGTVHDQTGAAVPSATVTITEKNTNVSTVVHSDGQGDYTSPPLHVGNYTVTASAPGFRSTTHENITLQVQDRIRVDLDMQVGQLSEKVVVSAEAPPIQTETSSLGQVITSNVMTELPLNGRDYVQLATLTTGVVETSAGTNGNIGGASTGGQDSFVANGARGTLNNFLLDGIDNNSNDNGGVVLRTNVDAIQEFKIQTNSFSAEFGRSGGAAINAIIKSGTNQYHGDIFEFFRNSALDARDFFEDPNTKKASFKQNQFGGTIGGPIKRDKLFWFGDYQGTVIRLPLTYVSSVPTAAQRTGDFSGPGNPTIYNPATYDPATGARTAFANNVIPSNLINPISLSIMNLYPLPNQPGKLKNNYIISPTEDDRIDQGDFRGDYDMSQIDQLFFRWSMSGRTTFMPSPLPGLAGGGGSSTGFGFEDTMAAALGETHTFTPTTINELRLGFNYVHVRRGVPEGGNVAPPSDLQVPGVPNNPGTAGITLFSPNGYRRVGAPNFAPTILSSEERQITDVLNLVRGRHTIKLGFEMRWSQYNIFQVPSPRGAFTFTGQFTQNPADGSGGSSLADELLGLPVTSTIASLLELGNRQHVPSAYVQDDFKVSSHLTLNLGLRYDFFSPIVEVNNKQSNFDYATGQLVVASVNGASRSLTTPDHLNFAPRIGFAWSPFNGTSTVIRSAYGIFYSGQEIRTAAPLQLAYNLPFYYQPFFISDGITPVLTVSQGFPPVNPAQAVDAPVTSVDTRLKTPYYQEWNFAIQQALPSAMSVEIAYAGSKGTHLQVVTDQNQVMTPGPGDIQPRRPYPNWGPFTSIQDRGNSTYNALQLKVQKRYTHGLSFLSAYTYSKAINDLPEICCAMPFPQNSYDLRAEKGLADFDQRWRWVFSFDYGLPSGHFLRPVLAGWHLGGIYTLAAGFPFSPLLGYDPSNTGDQGVVRADRIANGNLPSSQRSPNLWFDINAFPLPAPYTFGNSGRNVLIGPGVNRLDAAIRKEFAVTERQKVDFRAEFFNMLNHPNFAQPDNFIDDGPGAAGVITSLATPMRQIQFGLKYIF